MDLLQLRYFKALAEEQHFTRTAEVLHISQPALSKVIQKLESELGCNLFDRVGRNVRLSKYGEIFLVHVNAVFSELGTGKLELDRMNQYENCSLSLALLSPYIWQDMINKFTNVYPKVMINQQSFEGFDFIPSLMSGKFNFYLGALNNLTDDRLSMTPLYEDNMVILFKRGNPFPDKGYIDLIKCKEERFIMQPKNTSLQYFIDDLCRKAGFVPNVSIECDYTLRDEMVAAGHGLSITTLKSAKRSSLNSDTTYCILRSPPDKRVLGIVWHKLLPFTNLMTKFIKHTFKYYDINHDLSSEKSS